MLVSIVIITSTLHCGHNEWCVMIISAWCVFRKLLRPSWISKYIVKTGCSSVTVGCTGSWLFCHHRRTTHRWWSRRPSSPLFVWWAGVNSVSPPNRLVTRHRLKGHHGRIVLQCDDDHALWPDSSYTEATVMSFTSTQVGHAPMWWKQWPDHKRIISQYIRWY
jgi:hypothetical protein